MKSYKRIAIIITICMFLIGSTSIVDLPFGTTRSQITSLLILTQTKTIKSSSSTLYITEDYTFTGDVYDRVVIFGDNIVVDGNGYSVIGPGGLGVDLIGKNITLKDLTITGWMIAIGYGAVRNCTISGNILINNFYGIDLQPACSNNIITGNTIMGISRGMNIHNSHNNIISENTITNCEAAILLWSCSYSTISGNNIEKNSWGIRLDDSSNNIISENKITENTGTFIEAGIRLHSSSNNKIFGNNISRNRFGIHSRYSLNNIIYHNNFIDNRYHISTSHPANNYWHHPDLLEGNYWDNYPGVDDGSGTGKHSIAGDGIGDTHIPWPYPWIFPGCDYYPFIEESGWVLKVCQRLENLKHMVIDSPNDAWRKPAENRKNAMINKIDEAIVLCENEEYIECYDKILHDIKPKLTGLKVDEEGTPFGNGVFNNPWVIDQNLQQEFEEKTNLILGLLKSEF